MDINEDTFSDIIGFLPVKKLVEMTTLSKDMKNFIENHDIWCKKLKKDFHIDSYKDCFDQYKEKYDEVVEFYRLFGFMTPFMAELFGKTGQVEFFYTKDIDEEEGIEPRKISYAANSFLKHLTKYFWRGPTKEMKQNLVDNGTLDSINGQFGLDIENADDLFDFIKDGVSSVANPKYEMLFGVLCVYDFDSHPISQQYLNTLTMVWGGDTKMKRYEKMKFILREQNKLLIESVGAGRDLEGSGEDDFTNYYFEF
jgi:hypothetical protein